LANTELQTTKLNAKNQHPTLPLARIRLSIPISVLVAITPEWRLRNLNLYSVKPEIQQQAAESNLEIHETPAPKANRSMAFPRDRRGITLPPLLQYRQCAFCLAQLALIRLLKKPEKAFRR
jgi:hypothetical protein